MSEVPARPGICSICQTGPDEHAVAEREGVVHHKFSADGVLEEVKVPVAPLAGQQKRPTQVGDPVLRFVLVQKGIIAPEDLLAAERVLQATGMLQTEPTP